MNIRFLKQVKLQIGGLMYANVKFRNKKIECAHRYRHDINYALPFDGEWYTANGGVTKGTSHSWEILPQRYAYDFIMVDDEGKSYHGNQQDLSSYYCYGKDILAPADGVVISIKNGFPDCRIMSDGQPDKDTPDIGGNRIIIRHSKNEYSAICHLMPKSITVRKGQTVRRGDVIAKFGNSGNTTEPHVHFQIQNTPHFHSCMGIPILFSNIQNKRYEKYHIVDARPLPEKEEIEDGYIHRGLLVKNLEMNL